ncbi:hypothetical protein [Qipengyuania sp. NPDC077563]|uniref:hypothetical protein n=1 Tax=Qipengyuania sp. NPDC077563 TaxID=3364497 RepID=UPI0038509070
MSNKTRRSGHSHIENAQQLFERTGDYRYVALAIGSSPTKPPKWAMQACLAECERTESKAYSVDEDRIGQVLDDTIRALANHERDTRKNCRMSLRAAILKATGRVSGPLDEDSEVRPYRRAWDREQKEDRRHSYLGLEGYETTHRIHRVLMEEYGREFGMPTDPLKDFWRAENGDE